MDTADAYRAKAAKFSTQAKQETDPVRRADLEWLALSYRRLAEQAEVNKQTDIVYEPPPEQQKPSSQPQQNQQQQSKLEE